jgi:trigger factor
VKATIEETSETKRVIHVEVPADAVERKLDELYKRVVRTLELPGFRRGHVPRSFLEARFGEDFLYEDSQAELIEEYLPKALEDLEIKPASRPEPRVVEFEPGKPFVFEVDVEVFPEVELADSTGIEIEAPAKQGVTKVEIERVLEDLRMEHATLVPKGEDEAAAEEDVVVVQLPDETSYELQARSHSWTAPLLGARIGDELDLQLPERDETLHVKIEGIKRIELPDLDELAQTLGHEEAEELREEIRRRLKERSERDYEGELRMAALDALVEHSKVTVPAGLVEELLAQEKTYLEEQGEEPSEEGLAQLGKAIELRLRRDRALQALKEQEGLALSDEEFEAFLEEEAERQGMNLVKFKALLEREGQLERLRRDRENQRALDHLIEKVKIRAKSGGKRKKKSESEEE